MKIPKKLKNSEAFSEDPVTAQAWWSEGFRPMPAHKARPEDEVLYRDTDIFRLSPIGDFKVGRVEHVKIIGGDWQVWIQHTGCAIGDPTQSDYYDEIWVRRRKN